MHHVFTQSGSKPEVLTASTLLPFSIQQRTLCRKKRNFNICSQESPGFYPRTPKRPIHY